jgi:long-chain acyl-CoA synthetase
MDGSQSGPGTVPELARRRAAADGAQVALVADGTRSLTRAEWLRRAAALARGLAGLGVGRGDRVALLFAGGDWLDFAVADLAVQLCGGTAVGLSNRLSPARLRQRLGACAAAGLLHSPGLAVPPHAGWSAVPARLADGGRGTPGDPARPADLAEIVYTSGTTGHAKPVAVSHANLAYGRGGSRAALFGRSGGVLAAVPIGTNAGHSAVMLALTGDRTVHVLTRTDPVAVARAAATLRSDWVILPPAAATYWAAGRLGDRYDLSAVRTVMLGAAPVPAATVHRLTRLLPAAAMLIGYGSTESAPAFSHLMAGPSAGAPDPRFDRGSRAAPLGTPRGDVRVRICDGAGRPLPAGRLGEIWLSSPAPPRAYYGDPAGTAAVFRDGWTAMGDLGHLDDEGQLHFFDRVGDVIDTAGRRVSSLHVAGALLWHPDVVDAAAFGVPDRALGQAVVVAVELRSAVRTADLRAFLADWLEPHELPARIHDGGRLPRGVTGKQLKWRLRRRFARAGGRRER